MGLFSSGNIRKELAKMMNNHDSLFSLQGYFDQSGLPVEKQGLLGLLLQPDKVIVMNKEHEFTLRISQIKDVEHRLERETERELRTNTAGGIVGGVLLGPVGLLVGSQPKSKKIKDIMISSLTFSYTNSQGEASSIELLYKTTGDGVPSEMRKLSDMLNQILLNDKKPSTRIVEL